MPAQTELLLDRPQAADAPQAPYDAPIASLSPGSRAVFDAGRELWRYYHAQPNALPDASPYDIRGHFQGLKPNGHMNADSSDAGYNERIATLRTAVKFCADRPQKVTVESSGVAAWTSMDGAWFLVPVHTNDIGWCAPSYSARQVRFGVCETNTDGGRRPGHGELERRK